MYRIFSMTRDCRMYQLAFDGWSLLDGMDFQSLLYARDFIYETVIDENPNELDSFIAMIDSDGLIETTFPIMPIYKD